MFQWLLVKFTSYYFAYGGENRLIFAGVMIMSLLSAKILDFPFFLQYLPMMRPVFSSQPFERVFVMMNLPQNAGIEIASYGCIQRGGHQFW